MCLLVHAIKLSTCRMVETVAPRLFWAEVCSWGPRGGVTGLARLTPPWYHGYGLMLWMCRAVRSSRYDPFQMVIKSPKFGREVIFSGYVR